MSQLNEKDGRFRLRTRVPIPYRLNMVILWGFFLAAYFWARFFSPHSNSSLIQSELDKGLLFGICLFGPLHLALIWSSRDYKLSYDNAGLHLGGRRWTWEKFRFFWEERSIAYDEIGEILLNPGRANIQPFESALVRREGYDWEVNEDGLQRNFFISRIYCHDPEIRQLLQFMYTKVPDKFPPDLVEWMNA